MGVRDGEESIAGTRVDGHCLNQDLEATQVVGYCDIHGKGERRCRPSGVEPAIIITRETDI